MDSSIFFGGSAVAAVVAGAVALFAPCCISVMLPAYFATAFQNRRQLVAMTFLFATGVATVILPIALGAAAVQRFLVGQHTVFYTVAGVLLLGLAAYLLVGGSVELPLPGRRAGGRVGPLSVYSLGAFSGAASSCCAPVLAGVLALSGVAGSFAVALGLGAAYVFGMVAPLFAISLLWERFDWRSSRLLRPRLFSYRLGPLSPTISATTLISGALLAAMGGWVLWVGLSSSAMPSPSGWQAELSARLQHYGSVITGGLDWIPSWAAAATLILLVGILGRRAFRQLLGPEASPRSAVSPPERRAPAAPRPRTGEPPRTGERTAESAVGVTAYGAHGE